MGEQIFCTKKQHQILPTSLLYNLMRGITFYKLVCFILVFCEEQNLFYSPSLLYTLTNLFVTV